MPFIRDLSGEGDFDEDAEPTERPGETAYLDPEDYRYEAVNDEMEGPARVILDLMCGSASEFRVNYDGGCDEGFAHPDSVRIDGRLYPVEEIVSRLTRPDVVAKLAGEKEKSRIHHMEELSDQRIIQSAIDDLADELASRLLGRGYGTGEYTMYGAFVANLETLEMTDDPNATPQGDFY